MQLLRLWGGLLALATLGTALPQHAANNHSVSVIDGRQLPEDDMLEGVNYNTENALRCLAIYDTDDWSGMTCENLSFFKGRTLWVEPKHCYEACYEQVEQAMRMGFPHHKCVVNVAWAQCWMGYRVI